MSLLTTFDAVAEVFAHFKEVWDTTGYDAVYPNLGQDMPTDASSPAAPAPYARVRVRHFPGDQALSGRPRLYTRTFTFTAEIRVPAGVGAKPAYDLAHDVLAHFEDEGRTESGCVWFRNGRQQEIGEDGAWWLVWAQIDCVYDELR
jgi:hypothetical protein